MVHLRDILVIAEMVNAINTKAEISEIVLSLESEIQALRSAVVSGTKDAIDLNTVLIICNSLLLAHKLSLSKKTIDAFIADVLATFKKSKESSESVSVNNDEKNYFADDATVKILAGWLFDDGNIEIEQIKKEQIESVAQANNLMDSIKFDNKTGQIVNLNLPAEFRPTIFTKKNNRPTLILTGYVNDDEAKNFGTHEYCVKIFDACVLEKFNNKNETYAEIDGFTVDIDSLMNELKYFVLKRNGKAFAILADYTKQYAS